MADTDQAAKEARDWAGWHTVRRFLPYLWPAGRPDLRGRIAGAVVFVVLAVLTHDVVLNWIIGPLFITVWAWYVPVLLERWRERRRS